MQKPLTSFFQTKQPLTTTNLHPKDYERKRNSLPTSEMSTVDEPQKKIEIDLN